MLSALLTVSPSSSGFSSVSQWETDCTPDYDPSPLPQGRLRLDKDRSGFDVMNEDCVVQNFSHPPACVTPGNIRAAAGFAIFFAIACVLLFLVGYAFAAVSCLFATHLFLIAWLTMQDKRVRSEANDT